MKEIKVDKYTWFVEPFDGGLRVLDDDWNDVFTLPPDFPEEYIATVANLWLYGFELGVKRGRWQLQTQIKSLLNC